MSNHGIRESVAIERRRIRGAEVNILSTSEARAADEMCGQSAPASPRARTPCARADRRAS